MSFPIPANEAERLADLRRHEILDTGEEAAFSSLTELAAEMFRVPSAFVTLVDEDRQWIKACFGTDLPETEREAAFCAHTILDDAVLIVPDARADPRFASNRLVTGPPHIRLYAGAPLKSDAGFNLGSLCLADTKPRAFGGEETARLKKFALLVTDELQLRNEIRERRRAEEALVLLEATVQQATDSILVTTAEVDLPGPRIVFVNPALCRMTGYKAEELIGQTPRIFQGPKTDRAILAELRKALLEHREFATETINYRKDGSEYYVEWRIAPIRDRNGEVTHFSAVQRDITERLRTADALQAAKVEAERANLAKSEFLSRMSHELRTPLNAILGFAQLLEREDQDPEDAESVGQIQSAGKHLLGLINEVLDLARVEAGKLALTLEPVDVRATLEEALALVKPLAAERGVQLSAATGDFCEVLSSEQRLKQVMLNLLSNAVKYNRAGGSVSVVCEKIEDFLRIEISDTGRGISEENIQKLFIPFERLETGDGTTEGTGLGLSLSKHLVEAMGGKIGVKSVEGKGTDFWVELPLVLAPSAAAAHLRQRIPAVAESRRNTEPRTVLYIEDNLSNLRLVERIIARRPEIILISAMQGGIGLELARQHAPDLILLDLHLPDMLGDSVLERLRADPLTERIPLVMVSADGTTAQVERLRTLGVQDYLTKPIDVAAFLAVIDGTEKIPVTA